MSESDGAPATPKRRATPMTEWSKGYARMIGKQVKSLREERRMQIKDLVAATERLGHQLPRMTISGLEGGKRESVSVAEWLILAAALNVPPAALLLPLGTAERVEVLPDQFAPTDEALERLVGTPGGSVGAAALLFELRLHQDFIQQLQAALSRAEMLAEADSHRRDAETALRQLGLLRRSMRARGVVPPALPANVTERGDDVTAWQALETTGAVR